MTAKQKVINHLSEMSEEFHGLHPNVIDEMESLTPDPDNMYRCYISRNVPVLLKNAVRHWPAMAKWNHEYLCQKMKDELITVAITPSGCTEGMLKHMDAAVAFVKPEEIKMSMRNFTDKLHLSDSPNSFLPLHYIQTKNNNFIKEFAPLHEDVELDIPWATLAMGGKQPNAINLWMSDQRAISSLQKNSSEMILCVVKGETKVILHPPVDAPFIPYESYKAGYYEDVEGGNCKVRFPSEKEMEWIASTPIDPVNPNTEKYPLYKNVHHWSCTVHAGEALYLPSLWHYHIRQSHGCVSVNYCYNMDFDIKSCNFKLLEGLRNVVQCPYF